jgi:hypothetical protein
MVSAISSPMTADPTLLSTSAPAASQASTASAQLAPDTVSIGAAGLKAAASAGADQDGDSH